LSRLRATLIEEHRLTTGTDDGLLIGLQLTDSGRYSRPNAHGRPEPRILYHHPFLDRRLGLPADFPVLTDVEVEAIIESFHRAALMAWKLGFDFVDIKHCHGYLGHEFLSGHTRPGRYAGSFENRTRFLREVVQGIHSIAPGLKIAVRLSAIDSVPFHPDPAKSSNGKPGEGIPGDVSDNGEAVLITNASDEKLGARSAAQLDGGVSTLIVTPIMDRGALVGVVEAVNKLGGTAFDDDDLFALSNVTETASTALHNASLLMAERKVEILETLVTVSHEITSTLNLERMLQTIVSAPQAVIPYERAAIALEQRGRFKLSAVTGVTQVNTDAPEIAPLNSVLQWAALAEEIVNVRQHSDEIDTDREETRAKFKQYFAESGMRGFYALPLNDDTGRVGILSLESSDPDFLLPVHIEML